MPIYMKVSALLFIFTSIPHFCSGALTNHSEAPKVKSLSTIAEEHVGFVANLLRANSRLLPPDSPFTKALILSEILPRVLGIQMLDVIKNGITFPCFYFDYQKMISFEDYLEKWEYYVINGTVTLQGNNFVRWVLDGKFIPKVHDAQRIIEESILNAEYTQNCSQAFSNKGIDEIIYMCSWYNRKVTVAVKNIFPRDDRNILKFSFLTPVLYLVTTPAIERSLSVWNPVSISQVSNAAALFLFKNEAEFLGMSINESLRSFVLNETMSEKTSISNILDLLTIISLVQDDHFTEMLLSHIDFALIDDQVRLWIMQHIGTHKSDYLLRKFGNIGNKGNSGLELPKNVERTFLRELTHFYHHSHVDIFFQDFAMCYPSKHRVDVYTIDPTVTYTSVEQLMETCELQTFRVDVSLARDNERTMLRFVFPHGTKVTPTMVELLKQWAMNVEMNAEDDKLARLIILVDQVTIIRSN